MIRSLPMLLVLLSMPLAAQSVSPGNWDVKSTAVDLAIPGTAGFILRMMKGKSKTEHKCLAPDQAHAGPGGLFLPDPKAKCSIEQSQIAGGRIDQVMMCPQKKGDPLRVVRTGTYTASSFSARLTMAGQTPKGSMRVVIDQVGSWTAAKCR